MNERGREEAALEAFKAEHIAATLEQWPTWTEEKIKSHLIYGPLWRRWFRGWELATKAAIYSLIPKDCVNAIDSFLAKLSDEDKDTFNWLIAVARELAEQAAYERSAQECERLRGNNFKYFAKAIRFLKTSANCALANEKEKP